MKTSTITVLAISAVLLAAGCIHVTTESEIKPIHITMDVNLKVDKELDRQFSGERSGQGKGDFKIIKDMLDRRAAGVDNQAMLVARDGATEVDRKFIAEANASRLERFRSIARDNGSTVEAIQKRHVEKMRSKLSSGVWYQDDSGKWLQK